MAIQLGIVSVPDHPALPGDRGRLIRDDRAEFRREILFDSNQIG